MATLLKRRNNWIENKEKIPKIIIKFFFAIQLCFELDCGFVSLCNERYRCVLRNIFRIKSVAVLTVVFVPSWGFTVDRIVYMLYATQYATYLIILTFSKINVYDYLLHTVEILNWKQLKKLNKFGFAAIIYTMAIIAFKSSTNLVNCKYVVKSCGDFLVPDTLMYLPIFTLHLIPIIQLFILLCVYLNLSDMNDRLLLGEINFVNINSMYVTTAVCWDKIKSLYFKLVLVAVIFDTPKLMILLWHMLSFMKTKAGWFVLTVQLVLVFFITVHVFLPAFIVEMINKQCKEIRLSLNNMLIKEAIGDENKMEALNLLEYMDERKILDKAWNVMPLDMRLSLNIINVCVTYLIVLIQFTHIYD